MNNILLIEDDLTYSKIIKNFLEKNGFELITSTKVSDGLASLEKSKIDLVITDYRLPDGTGMDVLDYIIKNKSNIPVILITNYSDIRTAVKSMKMGAFEYITKPLNPDELLLNVKEAIKKKREQLPERRQSFKQEPKGTADVGDEDYMVGKSAQALKPRNILIWWLQLI
jgi:two-component system response regulator HydG